MSTPTAFRFGGVTLPSPEARTRLLDRLGAIAIDGDSSTEIRNYLEADLDRFLYTVALTSEHDAGRALEIGANPYFASILFREQRPALRFDYLNYFGPIGDTLAQTVTWPGPDGALRTHRFESHNINIEDTPLPMADGTYDFVLFCEVLEHFTGDPLNAIAELHRVLRPGGDMVLTTPNVARFENVLALIDGRNLYDPYSGYGPHGRHNREYTRHELHQLMQHAGFICVRDFTSDVHGQIPSWVGQQHVLQLIGGLQNREHDLGQYLFSRWKKTGPCNRKLPRWLYRSHPEQRMA